jgi:hypothetical protein
MNRCRAQLFVFFSVLAGAAPALAQEVRIREDVEIDVERGDVLLYRERRRFELEITLPVALVDRSTAGTGGAPSGYGYENDAGLGLGAEMRLYFREDGSNFFRHGIIAGSIMQAGPTLGADGLAFHTTYVDIGYTASALFPCMSNDELRWQLSGILALVGAYADAHTGNGGDANGADVDARNRAAQLLDHYGLGWRLAFDLSWHFRNFVVGVGLGGRQYFAIDSQVARVWTMDVGLRLGGRIDI